MLPTFSIDYMRDMMEIPHEQTNYLALVDIAVDLEHKYYGYASGTMFRRSLLDAPIYQSNAGYTQPDVSVWAPAFTRIFLQNINHNPVYQLYKTVLEVAVDRVPNFPCLPAECLRSFMQQVQERGPVYGAVQQLPVQRAMLGLAQDYQPLPIHYSQVKHPYIVGDLHSRSGAVERLLVSPDSAAFTEGDPSMEHVMFPPLFPHAFGFLQAMSKMKQYLKWRMTCLFSLFTLHKIYPLFMYAMNSVRVLTQKATAATLERDLYQYKQDHPEASEEAAYKHILKHSVPSAMPGSPTWHRNHFKDLLVYVEHYGMPDLFLTLTSDEVSETKWTEVKQLEELLQKTYPNLTFQDAPIECATIFHERLWAFLSNFIDQTKSYSWQSVALCYSV
jgi:ATP-dependent DNA helicase PIF1